MLSLFLSERAKLERAVYMTNYSETGLDIMEEIKRVVRMINRNI
jgi:hypothetical protein